MTLFVEMLLVGFADRILCDSFRYPGLEPAAREVFQTWSIRRCSATSRAGAVEAVGPASV